MTDAFLAVRFCAVCGQDTLFEHPACLDGHGVDCPEFACTVCGSAIVLGAAPSIDVVVRRGSTAAA